MRQSDIAVDGIRTRIEQDGDGAPLVLIHGLGGPLMWERVTSQLSKDFRVVSVHLPGFGESDCPPISLTTDQYANFLCNLLDALQIQSATLVGISYGGEVAVTFALRHPERIDKLILIASTGLEDHSILRLNFIWKIVAACAKHIVLRSEGLMCLLGRFSFYDSRSRPKDLCKKFHEQIAADGKVDVWLNALWNIFSERDEFKKKLQSLRVPTLILWGKHDRFLLPRLAEEFHRLIPNSTVNVLDACGHSVPLERAEEVCKELRSFF
ncbi:MAG: alpha/beta hydrolase [Ignavibacteriae bacterium]|nr:alpha/beta hydrolase [Ignavibacteria bacterium]MBI3365337.1 alpha/beta hydrolase [Ignavibacteriota bacterium]